MKRIANDQDLARGVTLLLALEPRFQPVVAAHGLPPLRLAPEGLHTLLQIITEQSISLKAAAAIWARVEARVSPHDAAAILAVAVEDYRALGLNGAKARAFHGAARAVQSGQLDLAGLRQLTEAEARAALLALPGVGPWTAEIYLMAALGEADIFPAGDRALQLAAHDLFRLRAIPEAKALARRAQKWSPVRAVAARLLWRHYRAMRETAQG
jgi:DNA-3-methyladenine glycosylase II